MNVSLAADKLDCQRFNKRLYPFIFAIKVEQFKVHNGERFHNFAALFLKVPSDTLEEPSIRKSLWSDDLVEHPDLGSGLRLHFVM